LWRDVRIKKVGCESGFIYDHHQNACVKPKENLKPLIKWPGGKSRVSKEIVSKIPEHKTYVEPFIGGGSIYFEKPLSEKNVINDKNKNLITLYKHFKKSEIKGCKYPSRQKWKKIKNKRDQGRKLDACEFAQLVNGSYGAMTNSWGYQDKSGDMMKNVNRNIIHYQNKLNKTSIMNQDFKKVIDDNDSKSTFFYLDPPYHKAISYNQKIIHPSDVASSCKRVKGRVMVSYNDHPDVRKAFPKKDGWKYDHVTIPYTIQKTKHASRQPTKELLITNF